MATDYKTSPSSRNAGGNGYKGGRPLNPMFLGIIIGLLLGIIIALVVALWLNKSAIPFMEKTKPLEPPPKLESKVQPNTEPPKTSDSAKAKPAPDKSRFDFYQILPGEKDASGKERVAPKQPVESLRPSPKLAEKPATTATEVYFLQAGAFQNETDADNLKAKIAFIGLTANVKSAAIPDKGTLFRVRLGPYHSLDEVNRIKAALSENGVGSAVVKTTDTVN